MKHEYLTSMRKLITLFLLLAVIPVAAQTMYICRKGACTKVESSLTGDMNFTSGGTMLTVAGTSYDTGDIDSITFTKPVMQVKVIFSDGAVAVENNTGGLVSVIRQSGGHVALYSSATEDKIEYIVSGSGSNNSLYIGGSYKLALTLDGVSITNPDSAAISVHTGKLVDLNLTDGTVNSLADGTVTDHDACLWLEGHAEVSGGGSLSLTGNYKHAMKSSEYMTLKGSTGTITVNSAVGDGIHCGDYFEMKGGTVNISDVKGDGVDADDSGLMTLSGGSLTVAVTAVNGNGLKCDSTYTQNGGALTVNISAAALSAKGINLTGNGFLNDGTMTMTVAANGSKGIKGDRNFTQSGGTITMNVTGGKDKVTDPTDPANCFGIKLDGTWTKTGGSCNITLGGSAKAAIKDATTTYDGSGVAI